MSKGNPVSYHGASRLAVQALAVLMIAACVTGTAARSETGDWRRSEIWDDGNAEFCAYEVAWSRYREVYAGRAVMILVKEPWAPDLEVKADHARADGFDVLKLNHVRDVATGIYTYHQMASVFLRRDSGELQKLSVTSSEGCGISTAHMVAGEINTRSYFDGQGEATRPYPANAFAEDGLAARLRDYVEGEVPPTVEIVPSFMTGYLPAPEPRTYRLSRILGDRVVPAGRFEVAEIRLESADGWFSYAFDRRPPHPLVHLETGEGTEYRLARCERIAYWKMNKPGGEAWLPQPVR